MRRSVFCVFAAGLFIVLAGSNARAQCVEDPREVELDKRNTTRLSSYLCADGRIKVEKFRLSSDPAALIVQRNPSKLLEKTLGYPKVVENEVFKTYADLVQAFGTVAYFPNGYRFDYFSVKPGAHDEAGSNDEEVVTDAKIKVFGLRRGGWYPAIEEIGILRKKEIPDNLNHYYSGTCMDIRLPTKEPTCKDISSSIMFWRTMKSEDFENYSKRVESYNSILRQFLKEMGAKYKRALRVDGPVFRSAAPDGLELLKYMAGGKLPDDFLMLYSKVPERESEIFADFWVRGIENWEFQYGYRISSDWLLIENVSNREANVTGITGAQSSERKLRPAAKPSASDIGSIEDFSETLAPGRKLLLPLRIVLKPEIEESTDTPDARMSAEVRNRRGMAGYSGNLEKYAVPNPGEYVYGPELVVNGMMIDGKRVALGENSANEVVFSFSSSAGHCPYLFSWDEKDGAWVERGKVLHKGEGRPREYSETMILEGFQARFRIEEREPELAHIDQAELAIALKDGSTLALKPGDARLAARDGDYAKLYWGDVIEFSFALPEGVAEADVVESRLTLTGYYERYANLLAANAAPAQAPAINRARRSR